MKTNQIHKYIESATTKTIIKLLFFFILKKKGEKWNKRRMKKNRRTTSCLVSLLFWSCSFQASTVWHPITCPSSAAAISAFRGYYHHYSTQRYFYSLPRFLALGDLRMGFLSFSCAPLSPLNMQISFGPFTITPLSTCY